ncbi:MAG: hypothetical protein JXB32_22365 [Deltaproteobacteria bacterium]|nr:hypothetical protein [Deltaproteobacteria bacterium]
MWFPRRNVRLAPRSRVGLAVVAPLAVLLHAGPWYEEPPLPGPPAGKSAADHTPRYYVAVGPLDDATGAGRDDVEELARRFLLDELARLPSVEPHAEIPAPDEFAAALEQRGLQGIVLQGSVIRLSRSRSGVSAALSMLVLDEDQSFRAMVRGDGDARGRTGPLTEAELPAAQADALRAAARAAVDGLDGYLCEL